MSMLMSSVPMSDASPEKRHIRVLIVDDSVVIRRLMSRALAQDDQIEVVGAAPTGMIALQRIPQLKPDVITLDIAMPEMDGLETLKHIRQLDRNLPVIMFSSLTERNATAVFDALSLGASDYVTKPANLGSVENSIAALKTELLPKIKQFGGINTKDECSTPIPVKRSHRMPLAPLTGISARRTRRVVAIGVSTGGPTALATLLPMFPKDFALPILIVQHMPPIFTRLLAERLNAISSVRVEEVTENSLVEPGKALIAAGSYHMRVREKDGKVFATTDQGPAENSCRPAVDVMFRSVADLYGGATIAVVLTGMGSDGLRGSEMLKEKGAYVIAQDEPSSVVWGMPGSVVKAGIANATLELSRIVPEILKLA